MTINLPPNIVNNALRYPIESLFMPQHIRHCGRAKRMTSSNSVIHLDSPLPRCPVNSFEAVATCCFIVLATKVLCRNIGTLSIVDSLNNLVSFFDLGKSEVNLSTTELAIDPLLILRTRVPWIPYLCQFVEFLSTQIWCQPFGKI